MTTLADMGRS